MATTTKNTRATRATKDANQIAHQIPTATEIATGYAANLHANVAEWYAQENTPETYAAFGEKNRAIWNEIQEIGGEVLQEVERLLRERQ